MKVQEVFDAVSRHAAQMKEKSQSRDFNINKCLYRAPDGNKCFIGCLLTDEEAAGLDRRVDSNVRCLIYDKLLPARLMDPYVRSILPDLQNIHDTEPQALWKSELKNFALLHELNTEALEEAFASRRRRRRRQA